MRDDGILTTRYLTSNHLGGVSVISDEVGTVDERMSYDAFGERRDPATWQPYATMPDLTDITDKGYTGQQQLDAVGLIHMNGRVYDPQIGRFISADPTVPDPLYSQAFNRYAYVYNNPLSATDPSGFDGCPTGGDCGTIQGLPGTWNLIGASNSSYQSPFALPPPTPTDVSLPPPDSLWNDNPISISTTEIPSPDFEPLPLPAPPPAPASPNSPQNGSSGQNPNDDGCGGCTDPNNVNSLQNAGPVAFQAVGSLGDLSGWGGTGKLRGISPVEIPRPSGHNIGSPDSGASHPTGSGGVPMEGVKSVCIVCFFLLPLKIVEETTEAAAIIEETATTESGTLVIGKEPDLGALPQGQRSLLGRLPNLGSPQANWQQNAGILRQEMSFGLPIRDATTDPYTGALINNTGFLRAERNLLNNNGWTYDPLTTMWYPPGGP